MMPAQMGAMTSRPEGAEESPRAQAMRERNERAWALVEKRLGESPYFAGDAFTAALGEARRRVRATFEAILAG